jgi:hypothetical protein
MRKVWIEAALNGACSSAATGHSRYDRDHHCGRRRVRARRRHHHSRPCL